MKPVYSIKCDECLKILGVSWEEIECKKLCLKCATELAGDSPKTSKKSGDIK